MCDILDDVHDEATVERVKAEVLALCRRFPVYER
jgi:glycine hydroxymethyltransferase